MLSLTKQKFNYKITYDYENIQVDQVYIPYTIKLYSMRFAVNNIN